MKYDIRCIRCENLIPYEIYAAQLRQKPFTGIFCPACGVEWPTKYRSVKGFGRGIKTKYLFPGMTRPARVQMYASCPACYSFWENRGDNTCPFCGNYVETLSNSVTSYVQPTKIIPKEHEIKQFKVDFVKN